MSKSLTIAEVLMNLNDGGAMETLASELRSCVTGKAGKVQLTINVKANGRDAVTVTDKVVATIPQADPAATMFYVTEESGLSRRDPRQPSLEGVGAA